MLRRRLQKLSVSTKAWRGESRSAGSIETSQAREEDAPTILMCGTISGGEAVKYACNRAHSDPHDTWRDANTMESILIFSIPIAHAGTGARP